MNTLVFNEALGQKQSEWISSEQLPRLYDLCLPLAQKPRQRKSEKLIGKLSPDIWG